MPGILLLGLAGCQNFPALYSSAKPQITTEKIEQLSEYGAKFATEYNRAAQKTCTKYTRLYQQGDWRAGWVLALQVSATNNKHCLDNTAAIQILETLESQKKIDPELLWLTQVHLNWLKELEQQTKSVSQLKRAANRKQSRVNELVKENQDLVEKLEALKAIETSINQ